jgi:hypothetical protein
LGTESVGRCLACDRDGDRRVFVDEIIQALHSMLFACGEDIDRTPMSGPSQTPTYPERTVTQTPTRTPSPTSPPECVDATVLPTYFYFPASGTARVTVEADDDCCWHVQFVARQPYPPCPSDASGTLQEIRCGSSDVEISVYCDIGHLQDGACWRIADRDVFVGCEHVTPAFPPTRTPTPPLPAD